MNSILLLVLLFTTADVQSGCYSTSSYYATTALKAVQYYHYSNDDDCVMYIIPNVLYQSGYYLELSWTTFDIEGSLPTCIDYVEVFHTRNENSIGRYCSGNSASATLFNMYSSDGYAKIRFKSDSSITRRGFRFTYKLKTIRWDYIGSYGDSTCYSDSSYYGKFYAPGWPKGYTSKSCSQIISVPIGKEVRIVVMDLDLRNARSSCTDANDNFQIRGSNSLYTTITSIKYYSVAVTSKHCGAFHPGVFRTRFRYAYLVVNKPFGSYPLYSNRGFMMGYIIYDAGSSIPRAGMTISAVSTSAVTASAVKTTNMPWGRKSVASIMGGNVAAVSALICLVIGVIS